MAKSLTSTFDLVRKSAPSVSGIAIIAGLWPFCVMGISHAQGQSTVGGQVENMAVKRPSFSVVSIKQNYDSDQRPRFESRADGVVSRRNSLMWLIQVAYGAQEERMVSGAPDWIRSERYDVEAKVDESDIAALGNLSPEQRNSMLQAVLEDRFKLKYHFETRDLPDFALVVAKNGPKLTESKPVDPAHPPHAWRSTGPHQISAQGMSMEELAFNILSTESQRLVIDKTGLTGKYDFTLQWSREDSVTPQPGNAPSPESSAPSIFTAIQEQLGLKLVPINVPTKILVIDHVERPSAN